ncbi:hypothetical protein [Mycobacterium sp. ST-F2]|uniref:hypothetical protein n=1 Tax=Mycobacterium sp. ST-F2 TaxID=1490484 RepID=UPI00143CBBBD|nr:hypothetical protein [Mycobacterium sp. ST-F2]
MHSMQSKLALRPFQWTVNDCSESVPQVIHTATKNALPVEVFDCLAIADPVHTLGRYQSNLFWQTSFLWSDQPLRVAAAAQRWCLHLISGMVESASK